MRKKTTKRKDEKLSRQILIDGSNLAHRAYRKFAEISTRDYRHTGMIYGFMRILHSYLTRWNPEYVVVTFDSRKSKKSNFRLQVYPNYKIHRTNLEMDYDDFNFQLGVIRKLLKYFGVPYIYDRKGLNHEGDDYMAWLAKHHNGKSLIVSTDKDFCQLLNAHIHVYNPFQEKFITAANCREVMGYDPKETVDYLSLLGDKSDDVPGYHGLGPVKIRQFLDQFGTIDNFLADEHNKFKGVDRDAMRILRDRNYKLISMDYALNDVPMDVIPLKNIHRPKKIKRDSYLKSFELYSFMTPEFMEPFKKLKSWKPTK